jgi:hypothetical protein
MQHYGCTDEIPDNDDDDDDDDEISNEDDEHILSATLIGPHS